MASWHDCEAVERDPDKVSGASSLFENLKDGATVDDYLGWFPGVSRLQVESVLDHEAASAASRR